MFGSMLKRYRHAAVGLSGSAGPAVAHPDSRRGTAAISALALMLSALAALLSG